MAENITTKKTTKMADDEAAVLAAIAGMPEPDRSMGGRLHAIIKATAPELTPKTWYGFARVCQGRQDYLLLPKLSEVQDEIHDARLQRQGKSRRRPHVADILCTEGVDCC